MLHNPLHNTCHHLYLHMPWICSCYYLIISLLPQMVKNLPAVWETQVWSLNWEESWRRKWHSTPVFLPGEFHGQRSLVGYSLWGHKKLDTTEQLTLLLSLFWFLHSTFQKLIFFFFCPSRLKGRKKRYDKKWAGFHQGTFFPSHEVLEKRKDPKSEKAASPLLIVSSVSLTNAI